MKEYEIDLFDGEILIAKTLVDKDIFVAKDNYNFYLSMRGYVMTYNKATKKLRLLHSLIMDTPKGLHTDHINHDKLDNRRSNLRVCTPQQNYANRLLNRNNKTGYPGVSAFRGKYRVFYKQKYLGVYTDIDEAVKAYNTYKSEQTANK